MKVIIAGCRDWTASRNAIGDGVEASGFKVTEVVSGGADGIDKCGENWADYECVDKTVMHANWTGRGRSAGPHRNERMARYADALIAFWDGKSKGTLNMIKTMRKLGKPYHVVALGNVKLVDLTK